MSLKTLHLGVADLNRSLAFYRDLLGMEVLQAGAERVVLSYGQISLTLWWRPDSEPYRAGPRDRYWKIGLTLPDVDRAVERLRRHWRVSDPKQFLDIGYLCHLHDPDGYTVELLQHRFLANQVFCPDDGSALGGPVTLGQVTLRVGRLDDWLERCRRLGLSLLSVQPVPRYQFTLYFLAFTQERPPNPDLQAVGNREWLWQRPYTTLELQHLHGEIEERRPGERGYEGLELELGEETRWL